MEHLLAKNYVCKLIRSHGFNSFWGFPSLEAGTSVHIPYFGDVPWVCNTFGPSNEGRPEHIELREPITRRASDWGRACQHVVPSHPVP